jgi:hypothetical protein
MLNCPFMEACRKSTILTARTDKAFQLEREDWLASLLCHGWTCPEKEYYSQWFHFQVANKCRCAPKLIRERQFLEMEWIERK